jgi:aminocarboxymuconate-semialdehyde decarboxylase
MYRCSMQFTGCHRGVFAAASAESGGAGVGAAPASHGGRRQVSVGGQRVKTIDIHAHCVIPEAQELLGISNRDVRFGRGIEEVGAQRLAVMDEQGIDVEALSINPTWYRAERPIAERAVAIQNERLAEYCARYPDRFVAFASVALQFPDLAAEQLEHAVKQLGLRGAAVGATVGADEFADPKFHPFWAKAEELGVLIFVHPQGTPDLARRLGGNGWLVNTIGNPLDTTITLSHMIFEGTFDHFPGLKLCSAHGGGFLPSYAARSDYALRIHPEMDTGVKLRKAPSEYLRDLYYDTLIFTSEALRHLAAEVGVSQLMLGTDHPYPWQPASVDHILQAEGFSDAERTAMLGTNAARLLGVSA